MPEDTRYGWTGLKIWKSATRFVLLNLDKEVEYELTGGTREYHAGLMFPMDSVESYRERAVAWLADHSELTGRTLERADWDEIYTYYKRIQDS